jgi:hypothetical protein
MFLRIPLFRDLLPQLRQNIRKDARIFERHPAKATSNLPLLKITYRWHKPPKVHLYLLKSGGPLHIIINIIINHAKASCGVFDPNRIKTDIPAA